MKQSTKHLIIFSLFSAGCAGIPRPDTNLCIVNAMEAHKKCYNMKRDYTANGTLKAEAEPSYTIIEDIKDLDKHLCIDPDGTAKLKAYLRKLAEKNKERIE